MHNCYISISSSLFTTHSLGKPFLLLRSRLPSDIRLRVRPEYLWRQELGTTFKDFLTIFSSFFPLQILLFLKLFLEF